MHIAGLFARQDDIDKCAKNVNISFIVHSLKPAGLKTSTLYLG